MAAISLEVAQKHLDAWLEADIALSTNKSYQIGSRNLTRSDAQEVKERIQYWMTKVERAKRGGGIRVMRVVPRDL